MNKSTYTITYNFTEEQRDTLNGLIAGYRSFRQARKELEVSNAGVYTMVCNYAKQLYKEGKLNLGYNGKSTVC